MPYKQILRTLVEDTPHGVGAIMVDWEGEAVQEWCSCDPYEMRFAAAHEGIILTRLKELLGGERVGGVEDVVVTASERHLIIGCIDDQYALMMDVGQACPVALALYRFRAAVEQLRREI